MRGAVSIGRRLIDPLSELVKIDPKSIGVGQYQHDVDQASLKRGLDDVVVSCVNGVGVELNTASKQLLSYVSGLGAVAGGKDRRAPRRAGPVPIAEGPAARAAARAEGVRAVRRVPAHSRRRPSARRERGAPGELRDRGPHGARPRVPGGRPAARRVAAGTHRAGEVRDGAGRPADAHRHPGRAGEAGARPAPGVRGVQLHGRRSRRSRTSSQG